MSPKIPFPGGRNLLPPSCVRGALTALEQRCDQLGPSASQNSRRLWVGRDFKDHLLPPSQELSDYNSSLPFFHTQDTLKPHKCALQEPAVQYNSKDNNLGIICRSETTKALQIPAAVFTCQQIGYSLMIQINSSTSLGNKRCKVQSKQNHKRPKDAKGSSEGIPRAARTGIPQGTPAQSSQGSLWIPSNSGHSLILHVKYPEICCKNHIFLLFP